MLHRPFNPLGTMQSATPSVAQLGGLLPAAETIPALGFARVTGSHGPIPAARQHTMQGPSNGPNGSRSYTAQQQHQPHAAQPSTSPPSSSRRPYAGFTTASRASNARPPARSSSRMAADEPTRHYPWALSSSDAAPPPSNSFVVASNKDTRTNEQGPPVIQYGANIYSSPPNAHAPAVQLSPPPNVHPAHVSQNQGTTLASHPPPASSPGNITSLHPTNTMATLSPPAISRKRSPSPLKLDDAATRSRTTPVPRQPSRNSRTPEQRQAVFVDSPIDYYSSLGSQVAALPPQSATFASGPLVAVVPTPVKPEFEESQIRMCVVCFDQEPDVRFAARCPTAGCQHGASVCVNCLERHILIAIHHSRTVDIKCPHSGCGKTLEYQDVYSSVRDWGQLVYYEQLLLRQEMGNNEDFVWCKNPLCRSGQVHKGGRHQPIVVCRTCHQKSCFVHDRPWHEGMTCQEFDQKLRKNVEQDNATRKYLVENTKPCPKCKRKIERNGGCDHMVCRPPGGCGHEFCWECFADGSSHKPECSNYTAVSRGRRPRRRTQLQDRPYVPAA